MAISIKSELRSKSQFLLSTKRKEGNGFELKHFLSFPVTSPELNAESSVTTCVAGQLLGGWRMIRPKGLFQCRLKQLVTFRADVFHLSEIIPANNYSPGNSHQHPKYKWPPYAFDNPENDGKALQCRNWDSGQDHHPAHSF